jgi:hypothetical protein
MGVQYFSKMCYKVDCINSPTLYIPARTTSGRKCGSCLMYKSKGVRYFEFDLENSREVKGRMRMTGADSATILFRIPSRNNGRQSPIKIQLNEKAGGEE